MTNKNTSKLPCRLCGNIGLPKSWLELSYRPNTESNERQKYLVCDPCYRWLDKTIDFRIVDNIRLEALHGTVEALLNRVAYLENSR